MNGVVRSERVRSILRLLGEAHEIGVGEPMRMHIATGLMREVGAAVAGVVLDGAYREDGRGGGITAFTLAGFDSATARVFAVHQSEGSQVNPYHAEVMRIFPSSPHAEPITRTHEGIVPRATWDRSAFVNEYARPAGLSHFLGSTRPLGAARAEGLGFMRALGDRPFSEEDRLVVHLLHVELPRLFGDAFGATAPRALSTRQRQTLELLLTGVADKEIATQLGLSLHTTRQYVKAVFRAYGVHSRAELIARQSARIRAAAAPPNRGIAG